MLNMSAMFARLTLREIRIKCPVSVLWFSGSPYTGTEQNRSDKMFSQLQPVTWVYRWLLSAPFCLVGSAVFQCMRCQWTTNIRQVDMLFFVSQSISLVNTVLPLCRQKTLSGKARVLCANLSDDEYMLWNCLSHVYAKSSLCVYVVKKWRKDFSEPLVLENFACGWKVRSEQRGTRVVVRIRYDATL